MVVDWLLPLVPLFHLGLGSVFYAQVCSYCLDSYGRYGYGIYRFGLYRFGLYSYGVHSYASCNYGLAYIGMAHVGMAYILMAHVVMAYIVMAALRPGSWIRLLRAGMLTTGIGTIDPLGTPSATTDV